MQHSLPGGCRLVPLQVFKDDRGSLVPVEHGVEVPFAIERVYSIFGIAVGARRGAHAHRKGEQLALVVQGSCTFLLDDGQSRAQIRLDSPAQGLTLPPMVWHEIADASDGCVITIVADHRYDEADYIRDYTEFERLAAGPAA